MTICTIKNISPGTIAHWGPGSAKRLLVSLPLFCRQKWKIHPASLGIMSSPAVFGQRDMAKWFCYTTMPRLTHQKWRKIPLNRLDGTSFCPICNPLTWWHLSPLCIIAEVLQCRRNWKMAQRMFCHKTKNSFSDEVFIT